MERPVQDIADKFGIGTKQLSIWSNDEVFQQGLEKFSALQDKGAFDELDSRAVATMIALLLLETKNKHKP